MDSKCIVGMGIKMEIFLDEIVDGEKISAESLQSIKYIVKNYINNFKEDLLLDSIKEVHFAIDLKRKVNQVRKKHGYDSSAIVNRDGARAYYFSINDGHIIVYDYHVIHGLINYVNGNNGKYEVQAFNLLLHELLHVHDDFVQTEMKILDKASVVQLTDALNIWAEYYAHRKAAENFKVHKNDLYYELLQCD